MIYQLENISIYKNNISVIYLQEKNGLMQNETLNEES